MLIPVSKFHARMANMDVYSYCQKHVATIEIMSKVSE